MRSEETPDRFSCSSLATLTLSGGSPCQPPPPFDPCRSAPWKCCAAPAIRSATTSPATPTTRSAPATTSPSCSPSEREQLLGVVDLYRYDPATHSEVVPVLGNKGAGKTHLLHSIKHGPEGTWQLLVTPGTYQKDTNSSNTCCSRSSTRCSAAASRRTPGRWSSSANSWCAACWRKALTALTPQERLDLFPAPGLARWARTLGLGGSQAQERTQWLIDTPGPAGAAAVPGRRRPPGAATRPASSRPRRCELVVAHIEQTEAHNTAGLMRRHILEGFARAVLLGDEADLASFLTYGFAELDFQVRPSRQDLVLALFKVLMEVLRGLHIPVVVAFDQLEDLLLARRTDDGHRIAEAFFAGIVQAMHQLDGISFLIFAERGLWNRFVPSLDGYIQDRLNNPIHVPGPRHDQGAAPGSAAAGTGAPRRRGPAAAGPGGAAGLRRAAADLPVHASRSSASPAPSRRCATCCSSSATCSTMSSTARARSAGRPRSRPEDTADAA